MIADSTEAVWQARQDVNQWLNVARHDGPYERITKPWLG
jgi:hypothetical protein